MQNEASERAPGLRLWRGRENWLALSSAALMAIVVYANSLANQFAYDDQWVIEERTLIHSLEGLGRILTAEYWPETFASGLYRPITLLSFALDWSIWSGDPFGFHLTNVLIHAAASALVVVFLLRFFPVWAAWAGGMVFAVHSVHTEAVANVVGRGELLAVLFILIGCVTYVRAAREGRFSYAVVAGLAVTYAAAGLSKEVGFVMPGLLLATDLPILAARRDIQAFIKERAPLYAVLTLVLILLFAARHAVLGSAIESVPDRAFTLDDSFPTRLFTMARVWPRYLELLVFPLQLSADYSPAVILPADQLTAGGALGFLIVFALIAVAAVSFRKAPELAMGIVWIGLSLLPVSNLIITAEIVLAERTLYLPSVAVGLFVGTLLTRAPHRRRRWVAGLTAMWVLFFSAVTIQRNPVWYSTDTVFEDLRRKHPESTRLLWGVASQFLDKGNTSEAQKWFERALEVWPYQPQQQAEYGLVLMRLEKYEEAEERAELAVAMAPSITDYQRLLVTVRLASGDPEGALEAAALARASAPPSAAIYSLEGQAYAVLGRLEEAQRSQEIGLRIDPTSARSWLRLARYRAVAGDTAAALLTLERARQAPGEMPAELDSLETVWRGANN